MAAQGNSVPAKRVGVADFVVAVDSHSCLVALGAEEAVASISLRY